MNENFYPPLPEVIQAIEQKLGQINRHLDALGTGLSTAIAERLDVPVEHVVNGPGSAALLQQLISAHASPGVEVVHGSPSFDQYPVMIRNAGATPVAVALRDHVLDLDAMAAAVTEMTRVVLLCNPNNPTGTALQENDLRGFLDALPDHVVVVLDEAYVDFAEKIADGVSLYRDDERVCVVRTFSKSYGLLGLRVGYAVAHEPVAALLRRTLPFFRVSTLGQAAAVAALGAEDEVRRRCAAIARERDRLRDALLAADYAVPPTGANFLWLPLGADAIPFAAFCAERGVQLRAVPDQGVRVSVDQPTSNDLFIELAEDFTRGRP
ncbi:aminotransferase class I/II-fold pyridoxal phosphate-dependent enzyme [Spirillospora sp. CA-294931]|uniref:aminotransferase class I/II-fold pyridoxal phosphate-dependent enzyme n=1 Tax=Spirillospora sp. CA-294931 TaxID=3240042 RepID=UPI003D8E6C7A